MKIKWTRVAVAAFIVAIAYGAFLIKEAEAAPGIRVGLGRTVVNSSAPWGEFGYELPNGWEIAAAITGAGDTHNGPQGEVRALSFSRIVRPPWRVFGANNYLRLGVAYVDGSALIGDSNFRLGIGLEWSVMQLEYFHYSSAGIHQPNTGVDGIQIRFTY
ncbi:acyloxyacyl hydrolase [Denitromonas halophila]|uniref:Acyloxyacyl hydrolase n=1 Tax=Denitromonas halophila TaxID=1629404 RepID=A0A557QX89_9RHOO|nr:acyloxyacyl hydrolase [Denitromonas halophila]TVO57513.1 acyloxyacyl hydrolase [Denitromonas halophila]